MKKINVGLVGLGTIGCGVARVLKERRAYIRKKSGVDLNLSVICERDLKAKRPVKVNKRILTRSIGKVLYDPKIDIVVELIGGINPAKDIVLEALRQGKHVVTANKALLSQHGQAIFALADSLGLSVGFEASVGGGVPVIKALEESFVANRIELIYGIINGTSNFILSKMASEGFDFEKALKLAQERGYAERDPSLDINGSDSSHKLSILALLGFGAAVKPSDIYTEGIASIEQNDIEYAKEMGYAVKLLAIGKRSKGALELRVHPTLIRDSHLLANVHGVYNAILVKGDLIGDNLFYGEGAGAKPTSSAVVSDIVAISKKISKDIKPSACTRISAGSEIVKNMDEVMARHYIRFSAADKTGVLARISGILAKCKISISSVTQKSKGNGEVVPIVMMTHRARERDMSKALKEIDALGMIKRKSVRIRVED